MILSRRPRTGLASALVALCLGALILTFLFIVWLPRAAGATSYGACIEEREEVWLEYSRTVVVAQKETATEVLFQKQIKAKDGWEDYPGVTRWESEGFTEEGWIGGVRYRYRPTEESRTVVVQPEGTETETEWFASPPDDDWTPTGEARSEWIEVEVPCPPVETETPPTTIDTPPTTVDHGPEPEADHTTPPSAPPVEEVVTSSISTDRPTLPRTGIEIWHLLTAVAVLTWLGGSLLGLELYDRRHRTRT